MRISRFICSKQYFVLLADVFVNFRNTFIKVHELDPAHFLSLPGLAWQACFKKKQT